MEITNTKTSELEGVSFLRHSGWVGPEDLTETLNIIGCGAVGSHIALLAARMGFQRFVLWDADVVEPHNLANQTYDKEHIGMAKVDALAQVLKRFNSSIRLETHNEFFTIAQREQVDGPLVLATDSMSSRSEIHDVFFMNTNVDHVYEVRLGFDYGELHVVDNVNPLSCSKWKNTLCKDEEVEEGPCNQRICTTLVSLVSSYAVHNLCARYAAKKQDIDWDYNSRTMFSLSPVLRINNL
jgi:hypothetical protein